MHLLNAAIFYGLAAMVAASALCVVLMRNVIHSALFLGVALAGVAGIFATLSADFLFAAQILIYVSGIAVLVLFVVMLSGRASDLLVRQVNEQWLAALAVCGVLYWTVRRLLASFRGLEALVPGQPTTADLGRLLTGDLAVPFELVSIILLVALAGAVYFSRGERHEKRPASAGKAPQAKEEAAA